MAGVTALSDYLVETGRTPFAWGSRDCLMWPADWVRLATGRDPAAPWRGRYDGKTGALRLLAEHGGAAGLMRRGCAVVGLAETEAPARGDVGVLWITGREGPEQVGGICTGARWAVLSDRGLMIAPFRVAAAWRVGEAGHG